MLKGEVLILVQKGEVLIPRKKYQNFQKISLTTSNIWCIINLAVNDSVFSNEKSSALIKTIFASTTLL